MQMGGAAAKEARRGEDPSSSGHDDAERAIVVEVVLVEVVLVEVVVLDVEDVLEVVRVVEVVLLDAVEDGTGSVVEGSAKLASAVNAGSVEAGSVEAGSTDAGSTEAGSTEGGATVESEAIDVVVPVNDPASGVESVELAGTVSAVSDCESRTATVTALSRWL